MLLLLMNILIKLPLLDQSKYNDQQIIENDYFRSFLQIGKKIQEVAAKSNLKRVTLELGQYPFFVISSLSSRISFIQGGKSPLIICEDADCK